MTIYIILCPGSAVVKNSPVNAGDIGNAGSVPRLGRSPGEVNGNLLQYPCLENLTGQRSLAGYSPRGLKESDTKGCEEGKHSVKARKVCAVLLQEV